MNNYIDDPVFGHMEYRHRIRNVRKKMDANRCSKSVLGKTDNRCGTSQLSKIPGESARNAGASFAKSN